MEYEIADTLGTTQIMTRWKQTTAAFSIYHKIDLKVRAATINIKKESARFPSLIRRYEKESACMIVRYLRLYICLRLTNITALDTSAYREKPLSLKISGGYDLLFLQKLTALTNWAASTP